MVLRTTRQLLLLAAVLLIGCNCGEISRVPKSEMSRGEWNANAYGKLPLSFEENRGQTDSRVKFLSRGQRYSMFLTPTEAVLKLRTPSKSRRPSSGGKTLPVQYRERSAKRYSVVRIRLEGANPNAIATGVEQLAGKSNYYLGRDHGAWRTGVPTFAGARFQGIYPGVDLVYRGTQGQLEYDLIAAPGADPNLIRLNIDGADSLAIGERGDLIIKTAAGEVLQKAPTIYQERNGEKRIVRGGYVLRGAQSVAFRIGEYDKSAPLIIDPILSYASYLGGSSIDFGTAIAVDSEGEAIVTGYTASIDFPVTPGAFQNTLYGADDVFITKINAAGTGLIYSTFAGGGNEDEGAGIAVDPAGNAYITGYTMSPDFPVTVGALQTIFSGSQDAFVTALDQSGGLIYSTFLGGSAAASGAIAKSSGAGIAVDNSGDAFVTGTTTANDFPVTPGAYQTSFANINGENSAAFVSKLNPIGAGLIYSTYLGPPNYLEGRAIAIDGAGDAYVAGTTYPGGAANGAMCPANNSECAFAAKLDSLGATVDFSRLISLENSGYTQAESIAVDARDNSHVVGNFGQPGTHFGFLENLDSAGIPLNLVNFSSRLAPSAVAVASSYNLFVTGTVFGASITTTPGAFQPQDGGNIDAYLSELDPRGTLTLYSTYIGGGDQDGGLGLAVDTSGNAYVTGYTQSSDFPITPGVFQSAPGGGSVHTGSLDAFVARIVASPGLSPTATATSTTTSTATLTSTPTPSVTPRPTATRTPLPTRVPTPKTATATATPTPAPTAVSSIATIKVIPSAIDFGRRRVNSTSGVRYVKVMNPRGTRAASIDLGIEKVSTNGAFAIEIRKSSCKQGASLAPGKNCKVAITFAPTTVGISTADALSIKADGAHGARLVSLRGVGY